MSIIGEVVGGKVVKSIPPEIGILDIDMEEEKKNDLLFSQFPNSIKALQWHSYEVAGLEKNINVVPIKLCPI